MQDTTFSSLHSLGGIRNIPEDIRRAAAGIKHDFADIMFAYCRDYPDNLYYRRSESARWSCLRPYDWRNYRDRNRGYNTAYSIVLIGPDQVREG